jgi:(2Fe-2S) ferredoxin
MVDQTSDRQVLVCQHVNCEVNGAQAVLEAFQANAIAGVEVVASACQGQCNMGATVRILPDEIWYYRVKPVHVPRIVQEHFQEGKPVVSLLHPRMHPQV